MLTVAFALAAVAAEPLGSKPKWVPLNQSQTPRPESQEPERAAAQPAQSVASPPAQPTRSQGGPQSAPTAATNTAQGRLDLTCFGGGTANKAKITTVDSNSSFSGMAGGQIFSGSGSGSSTIYGTRQQGFGDQVDIRLFGGDDRIRMPRTMLPPLHGGQAGWFKLKNVVADARSIRASAAVNFMNNPKVFIDRVTGTISISGRAGDYAGQCQVIDTNAAPKF